MISIKNETANNLLKRKEIQGTIDSKNNPGFEAVTQSLAALKKVPQDSVVIKSLKNNYGANEFLVEAFVYESTAHKDRIEQKPKPKKKVA